MRLYLNYHAEKQVAEQMKDQTARRLLNQILFTEQLAPLEDLIEHIIERIEELDDLTKTEKSAANCEAT